MHPQTVNQQDSRLEKVKRFIDENPQERYIPVQLAETAELSEKYLRCLFKLHYGVTPLDYHKQTRMNYARFLLAECGHSIKH
jgi:AraC-like DNA-binding protein